jgi:hypothetical protein
MLSMSRWPPHSLWVACIAAEPGPSSTTTHAKNVATVRDITASAASRPAWRATRRPATTKPALEKVFAGWRTRPSRAASQKFAPRPTSGPSQAWAIARTRRRIEPVATAEAVATGRVMGRS